MTSRERCTVVVDLNAPAPLLPAGFDVVVAAGVLEYLTDPAALFRAARTAGRVLIVTYTRARYPGGGWWLNRLTGRELRVAAYRAGWRRGRVAGRVGRQLVWRFT